MEVGEEEDDTGNSVVFKTPVFDRKKATPRRRLLSSGKGRRGENKTDESQRLISVMFSKNILGVERLSEDNQKGDEPKPKI